MTENPAPGRGADNDVGSEVVRLEVADGVAVIRVDRPRMNALDAEIQGLLGAAARECDTRPDVAAVVITGGPSVFAAGADIKEMAGYDHATMITRSGQLQADFAAVARIGKPVVAAVNGYALGGGCELALCADLRFAAEDAVFGQPEIKLGLIPGAGGTQRLARLVGPARAKELIFSGRFVPAAEALGLGLVDRVVAPQEVLKAARDWAAGFVGGPALALRAAKSCVDLGLGLPLEVGLEYERQQFAALFGSEDRGIGMAAFAAKETPRFVGR